MRRALVIVAVLAIAVAIIVPVASGGSPAGDKFKVVLDNSFGLTKGADLKSDGVKVGKITDLDVQRRTGRALVTAKVQRSDFAGFRKDVFCQVEPQSLIGEYFLNCEPGHSPDLLPDGATVPVTQTAGTIPPDLVEDILRRPERERFGLILAELGGGFAARGDDLQATIRRAVPALRETDRVLQLLADNRRTLQSLTRNADAALVELGRNHRAVGRFVTTARNTAVQSAARHDQLAATIHKLPGFLRELRPTLTDLGSAARQETPALADLRASAGDLTTLLRRLGPFSDSARPAIRGLGRASVTGRQAVKSARPTVARLRSLGADAVDPVRNARFILEDIDNPDRATEPNRLAPVPEKGFTGLEAMLQYFFVQSQAVNLFDSRGYTLKLDALVNECTQYTNAQSARADPGRTKRCNSWLGPNQLDVTTGVTSSDKARSRKGGGSSSATTSAPAGGSGGPSTALPNPKSLLDRLLPKPPKLPLPKVQVPKVPLLPDLPKKLGDVLPRKLSVRARASSARSTAARNRGRRDLLDYLLGP